MEAKPGIPSFCRELATGADFDWAYYLDQHVITADRVLANTFYLFFRRLKGVFKSTDGGAKLDASI